MKRLKPLLPAILPTLALGVLLLPSASRADGWTEGDYVLTPGSRSVYTFGPGNSNYGSTLAYAMTSLFGTSYASGTSTKKFTWVSATQADPTTLDLSENQEIYGGAPIVVGFPAAPQLPGASSSSTIGNRTVSDDLSDGTRTYYHKISSTAYQERDEAIVIREISLSAYATFGGNADATATTTILILPPPGGGPGGGGPGGGGGGPIGGL